MYKFKHYKLSTIAIFSGLFAAAPVAAQSYQCSAPRLLKPASPVQKPASESRRMKPISSYTLALSWSPEYCRTRKNDRNNTQCNGRDGSFAFILHGLWPDAAGGYPRWCRPTKALSPAIVRGNFCALPSARLMAKQWAKHGTCMTKRPETYFRISRVMFDAVQFPDMDRLSRQKLNAEGLRNAFSAVNPGVSPDMLRLKVNKRGWLEEVRICLGQSFKPRRCSPNMRGVADKSEVKIWRGA